MGAIRRLAPAKCPSRPSPTMFLIFIAVSLSIIDVKTTSGNLVPHRLKSCSLKERANRLRGGRDIGIADDEEDDEDFGAGGGTRKKGTYGSQGKMSRVRRIADASRRAGPEEGYKDDRENPYAKLRRERMQAQAADYDPIQDAHEHVKELGDETFFQLEPQYTFSDDPDEEPEWRKEMKKQFKELMNQTYSETFPNETLLEPFGYEKLRNAYRSWDWNPRNPDFVDRWNFKPSQALNWTDIGPWQPLNRSWWNILYALKVPGVPEDNVNYEVPSDWKRLHLCCINFENWGNYQENKKIIDHLSGLGDSSETVRRSAKAKQRIMYLGCGTTEFCIDLCKDGYGEVVGVDWSEEAIRQQRMYNLNTTMYPRLSYQCMDVTLWDEPDNAQMEIPFDMARAVLDYPIIPFDPYTVNKSALGTFDVILDKGCMDCVMHGGPAKLHAMLSNISRSLKPGGRFIVYSDIQPLRISCPLNYRGYNWTVRFEEVEAKDVGHRIFNSTFTAYVCTKHAEDGTRLTPSGTPESDQEDDKEVVDGYTVDSMDHDDHFYNLEAFLKNPTLPNGHPRRPSFADAYRNLEGKYGWIPMKELMKEIRKEKAENEGLREESEKRRQQQDLVKQRERVDSDYYRKMDLKERGLEEDVDIEDEQKSHTSVSTDEYKQYQEGADPFDGYDPMENYEKLTQEEKERIKEGGELPEKEKPLWMDFEHLSTGQVEQESITEKNAEDVEKRIEQANKRLLEYGFSNGSDANYNYSKPLHEYAPPSLEIPKGYYMPHPSTLPDDPKKWVYMPNPVLGL